MVQIAAALQALLSADNRRSWPSPLSLPNDRRQLKPSIDDLTVIQGRA